MRLPAIDLLRSLAIHLMVIYHGAYDLEMFAGWDIDVNHGWWRIMARATASLFLLLVGISFHLSYTQARTKGLHGIKLLQKYAKRAAFILGAGILVSLATYIADPETFVRFGILHCIAVTTLLLPFLMPLRIGNIFLGIAFIALGMQIHGTLVHTHLLLPLGFLYRGFATVDYFPLLPWSGVVLIGMGMAPWVIATLKKLPRMEGRVWRVLGWPGRYALWIYLLHQPILFFGLQMAF